MAFQYPDTKPKNAVLYPESIAFDFGIVYKWDTIPNTAANFMF